MSNEKTQFDAAIAAISAMRDQLAGLEAAVASMRDEVIRQTRLTDAMSVERDAALAMTDGSDSAQ